MNEKEQKETKAEEERIRESAESAEQLNFMVLSEDGMSIYIGSMRCSRKI